MGDGACRELPCAVASCAEVPLLDPYLRTPGHVLLAAWQPSCQFLLLRLLQREKKHPVALLRSAAGCKWASSFAAQVAGLSS